MAAISDPTRLVLQSILASQSPQALPQQRKDAVALLEQVKGIDGREIPCAALAALDIGGAIRLGVSWKLQMRVGPGGPPSRVLALGPVPRRQGWPVLCGR